MTSRGEANPPTGWNLLYENTNPNPATICEDCKLFIGHVFRPEDAPPVPMHNNCYCLLTPTTDAPTWPVHGAPDTWQGFFARLSRFDPIAYRRWVQRAAWYLRRLWPLGIMLPLAAAAEEYNRQREAEREPQEDTSMPEPASDATEQPLGAAPGANRGKHTSSPQNAALNGSQRAALGRVLLQSREEEAGPLQYDAVLVQPGFIRNADGTDSEWLIPAAVLRDAADRGLFSPVSHYVDHPEKFGFGWPQTPSVRDLGGLITGAHWDPELDAVRGTIRLYDTEAGRLMATLYDQILSDQAAGLAVPPIGLSIAAYRQYEVDKEAGHKVWTTIRKVDSVDLVYEPGAAGYIRQALSAMSDVPADSAHTRQDLHPPADISGDLPHIHVHPTKGGNAVIEELTHTEEEEPTPALDPQSSADPEPSADPAPPCAAKPRPEPSRIPSATQPATPNDQPDLTPTRLEHIHNNIDRLEKIVGRLSAAIDQQAEDVTIHGLGHPPRQPSLTSGRDSLDRIRLAAEALLSSTRPPAGIRPLTGIRELYTLLSGDYELTGRFDADRVYLANVNTSTMSNIVADVLNKRVINMFQSYDHWWRPAVTVQDFATLQDIKWITLGGVSELPTVAEGAAYTEMTWDDQRETTTFIKKGGFLGITLETIDKDDTSRVMAAPRALAQAAWMTLGKSIARIFTMNANAGPEMSDSDELFHSNHNNLGTTALSFTAWQATKVLMMKQTELNSNERLGALTRPRLLWVPIDLEDIAIEILAAGEGHIGTADYHVNPDAAAETLRARIQAARTRVITVPFWTSATNWAAQADPNLYPSIGLGFRYGRTPEIFSVADPRAGLMFTNDTMPIKVRFFYAVGPTDWRGLYKHNV